MAGVLHAIPLRAGKGESCSLLSPRHGFAALAGGTSCSNSPNLQIQLFPCELERVVIVLKRLILIHSPDLPASVFSSKTRYIPDPKFEVFLDLWYICGLSLKAFVYTNNQKTNFVGYEELG